MVADGEDQAGPYCFEVNAESCSGSQEFGSDGRTQAATGARRARSNDDLECCDLNCPRQNASDPRSRRPRCLPWSIRLQHYQAVIRWLADARSV